MSSTPSNLLGTFACSVFEIMHELMRVSLAEAHYNLGKVEEAYWFMNFKNRFSRGWITDNNPLRRRR